ncbi:MAG: ParB/RepB/Spo0J family partition protein [Kiloniellales bacterium]
MSIETVTLSSLEPPAANPRSAIDTATIEGLAASISTDGLLQNLVVTKGRGKSYRIISGERRYRALKLLEERGAIGGDHPVPVEIRVKLSEAERLRLATVENVQRENLPPLDEAKAFAALIRKGASLDDLAARTGLSVTTIRRRLVLNDLCKEVRAALAEGAVSLAQAEALTLGDFETQRTILEEIESGHDDLSAAAIRAHLLDDRPSVAMAVFALEQYSGTITTDLFAEGETSYFDDSEQFFTLQQAAVEKLVQQYEGKAAWVEITNSYRIPDWQYEKAGEGEPGGVLINLSLSGRVEIREGLAKQEIDPDTRAVTAENPVAPKKPKAAYSAPLCRHIGWHKSLAVQELLLSHPRKAREIAAVDRLVNLAPHEGVQQLERQEERGDAYAAVEAQARLIAARLGFTLDGDRPYWTQFPPRPVDVCALYEAVRSLSDRELDELHTLLAALVFGQELCERLDTRDSLFNRVARDLGADMRNHWQPDRAFLERRNKAQLCAIARDCGYAEGVGSVASWKKGELVSALVRHFAHARAAADPTPAQVKAREWQPEAMLFPAVDPDAPEQEPDEDEPFGDEPVDDDEGEDESEDESEDALTDAA